MVYLPLNKRLLYDLWIGLRSGEADSNRIVECFQRYMDHDGATVSRAEFEANLAAKLRRDVFIEDIQLLIPADAEYDPMAASEIVQHELIAKLPGVG